MRGVGGGKRATCMMQREVFLSCVVYGCLFVVGYDRDDVALSVVDL